MSTEYRACAMGPGCFPCGRSQYGDWCSNPNCPAHHKPVAEPRTRKELLAAIDADFASGRLGSKGDLLGTCGVISRYLLSRCGNNSGIMLSASDALMLVRAPSAESISPVEKPEPPPKRESK